MESYNIFFSCLITQYKLRSTRVASVSGSFFFISKSYSGVIYSSLFIHLLVDVCFRLWALIGEDPECSYIPGCHIPQFSLVGVRIGVVDHVVGM